MADDISKILEQMTLTLEEEEIITISDEGRREELEGCALSLIGKILTCKSFNKKAALGTLKKAWGLEDEVQVVEVGSNLFQFKFRSEFELDRVYTGGVWCFDNQALLLTRWKSGMTATNVKFDSVPLWVQIWGAPFDMRSYRVAAEVGNRLGKVLEVEKRRTNDSQNFFMRVKIAIPLDKEIRRGAFLAGSDGEKHWVHFKYERLPVFCHYCGLLGHDLRYCAKYFSKTKAGIDVDGGYGDWLKAGGRARSPLKRRVVKEGSSDEDNGVRKGLRGSQSMPEVNENGGGKDGNPNKTVLEHADGETGLVGADFADHGDWAENHGLGEVDMENRASGAVDIGVQSSSIEGGSDLVPALHKEQVVCTADGVGLNSNKKKTTWTRLARMDVGPMGILKEGAKILWMARGK
ncbi:uncharacterized protein CFP56_035475 [Quercus suber]|uniref:DUF4283 domain-containing protein n=1 Tax=Quercus suber TaxID=58331 RepID=A0AAW0LPI4_QUESU